MAGMSVVRATLFRLATSTRLEQAVRATPQGQWRAGRAAQRYVAGTSADDAWRVASGLAAAGIGASMDQFGELVTDTATAERVAADYLRLAGQLGSRPEGIWLSVDLSHLGLDISQPLCTESLAAIATALPPGRRIQVGAEDAGRTDPVLARVLAVAGMGLADRLGATLQANLHRSGADLDRLVDAGLHVRLVKGAYVEPPDSALPFGEATDIAYLQLAHRLAESGADFALATHDGVLRESLLAALGPRPVEQLLGVRPELLKELVARGIPARVYVPFGANWFRYWMRRLAESRGSG